MICPACSTPNAPGAPFCAQCSAPLPVDPSAAAGAPPSGDQFPPPPSGEYPPPAGGGQFPPPAQPGGQVPPSGEQFPPPPSGQFPPAGSGQYPPAGSGQFAPAGSGQYPPAGSGPYPPADPYGQPQGYGAYPPGYGGPPPGQQGGGGRRTALIVLAVIAVGAIVAGLIVVLSGGDDEKDDQVVLEPIDSVQQDDFAGNLDLESLGADVSIALQGQPAVTEGVAALLAGASASGTEPGLYGGSRDAQVCDVQGLIDFLTDDANSGQAQAWAEAEGISVDDIESYVQGLTPVRLRYDTRVTNHGYADGEATPFQSVLQAGTAVMVDDTGVPRVKCNCGNPLLAPEALGDASEGDALDVDALAQNPDDAWDGFDTAQVVSVEAGDSSVENFTLTTLDDGSLFDRPVGTNGDSDADPADVSSLCDTFTESPTCGGSEGNPLVLGSGEVQITLEWDSNADLDLHVVEPGGSEIFFSNPGPTGSGGQLDVDSNVGCDLDGSVENVFWPETGAPVGNYIVKVVGFDVGVEDCGQGDYTLTIKVAGQDDIVETGVVGDEDEDSYSFAVS
ncbi:MAG TPA: DUF6777 domain-containing protein [Acidimicrobiales bacterium]